MARSRKSSESDSDKRSDTDADVPTSTSETVSDMATSGEERVLSSPFLQMLMSYLTEPAGPQESEGVPVLERFAGLPMSGDFQLLPAALAGIRENKKTYARAIRALATEADLWCDRYDWDVLEAKGHILTPLAQSFRDALGNSNREMRKAALRGLSLLGAHAATATPEIESSLTPDKEIKERRLAAWVIGRMGESAKEALPALRNLSGEEGEVGWYAAASVFRITHKESDFVQVEMLFDNTSPGVRSVAAQAIAAVGEQGTFALPCLIRAARQEKDTGVLKEMLSAIGHIGSTEPEVLELLSRMLKHGDEGLQSRAIRTAKRLGGAAILSCLCEFLILSFQSEKLRLDVISALREHRSVLQDELAHRAVRGLKAAYGLLLADAGDPSPHRMIAKCLGGNDDQLRRESREVVTHLFGPLDFSGEKGYPAGTREKREDFPKPFPPDMPIEEQSPDTGDEKHQPIGEMESLLSSLRGILKTSLPSGSPEESTLSAIRSLKSLHAELSEPFREALSELLRDAEGTKNFGSYEENVEVCSLVNELVGKVWMMLLFEGQSVKVRCIRPDRYKGGCFQARAAAQGSAILYSRTTWPSLAAEKEIEEK